MVSKQDNRRQHHLAVHTQFGRFGCFKTDEIRIKRVKTKLAVASTKFIFRKLQKEARKWREGEKRVRKDGAAEVRQLLRWKQITR